MGEFPRLCRWRHDTAPRLSFHGEGATKAVAYQGGTAEGPESERGLADMRIVHALTRLLRAGSEENTVATCRWQAAAGHEVFLIHGPGADPYWADQVGGEITLIEMPEMVHPIRPGADLAGHRAMRRELLRLQPDVLHTHQSKAGILGRFAASAVPGMLVAHGVHILPFEGVGRLKAAGYILAERLAARRTDLFITVSDSIGRAYVEAGICRPERMHTVYSGMALDRFVDPAEPSDADQLLGVADGAPRPPVLLMLAAFEPRKRHIPFLEVFEEIRAAAPDVRLLFAGAGPAEAAVRAAVDRLGLTDSVIFCGFRPDPEALIALADLMVLTSEREGLPRVAVQSIAAGCPMVVTDLSGIEEIVKDGVNGLVTDPSDLRQAAKAIAGLLTDPDRLDALRKGAAATDASPWTLDRLGARTTALYEQALAERAQRQAIRADA